MLTIMVVGAAIVLAGLVLCVFTSREASRRLDGKPWYVAVELLTLTSLVAGSITAVAGAVGIIVQLLWRLGG